jgi:hypothetical protein
VELRVRKRAERREVSFMFEFFAFGLARLR